MHGFEIIELGPEVTGKEMSELTSIVEESLSDEITYQLRTGGMSTAERTEWVHRFWLGDSFQDPAYRTFAIRDTKTGVLVAYTGLQFPYSPSNAEETKKKQDYEARLNAMKPQGRNFQRLFRAQVVSVPEKYGYDPTKHFHKRNTLMLPAYHRRGLGTWLTQYCNDIADKAGSPTYVMARPKAWKMLEVTGFDLLQTVIAHADEHGEFEDFPVKIYKRSPR